MPIRFHSTLDVSIVTVTCNQLAIQYVLSCQSGLLSQAACLHWTTQPINSYWLWHTCPSKMSGSVLIFPESCSLPPFMPPRVRSLSWLIVYVHRTRVLLCSCHFRPMNPLPLTPSSYVSWLLVCGLNETIRRPDSLVSPVTRRSDGAEDLPHGP